MSNLIIFQNGRIVTEISYDSRINQSEIKGILEFTLKDKVVFRTNLKFIESFEYLASKTIINLTEINEDIRSKLRNAILEDILAESESEIVSEIYSDSDRLISCEILFKVGDNRFRLFISKYSKSTNDISVNFTTIDNFVINAIRNL